MTSVAAIPAKGSEEERGVWKQWARCNHLLDKDGNFRFVAVSSRRRVFRNGLDKQDSVLLARVEGALIDLVHFRNAVTERWPNTIRVMLNNNLGPFESWVGLPGLEKRKQSTRVWTDLIQFHLLEYHINNMSCSGEAISMRGSYGYLVDMGLNLSDDLCDDIMDIMTGSIYGDEHIKNSVHEFCLNIIMEANPTPQNNPLLFWVALILQTEEFGDHPHLEFGSLKDELTTREKLEALVHYARVFILDHAFRSWQRSTSVPSEWNLAVGTALDSGLWGWCDEGLPRPIEQEGDPTDFTQPHWQSFKAHFDDLRMKWLSKGSKSPIGIILELL